MANTFWLENYFTYLTKELLLLTPNNHLQILLAATLHLC